MKRTLYRDWSRVRMPTGDLYYWSYVSEHVITQVYRDGSYWRWLVAGFTNAFQEQAGSRPVRTPIIWKQGTAQTKNEACWYAERAIPDDADEQTIMVLP